MVVELCDQQLHPPATEELHAGTQQHAEVFGGVQPARLLGERSIVGKREEIRMIIEDVVGAGSGLIYDCCFLEQFFKIILYLITKT